MSNAEQPVETARFAREWNLALALVATAAGVLFAAGHPLAGALAVGLCGAACLARRNAMRRQGRGFYGQKKHPG